jgi:hypothetical protein
LLDACGGSYPRFLATLERLKTRGLGPAAGAQTFDLGTAIAALTKEGCAPDK